MPRLAVELAAAIMICMSAIAKNGASPKNRESVLPQLMVEANRNKVLHVLAYMRDYSELCGNSDTVFLFREKLVDYMITANKKVRFEGWTLPRTLLSRSYYRFTNAQGLDSVSDECVWYFSWTDWMSLPPLRRLPEKLCKIKTGNDTLFGKYSPCVKWLKRDDRVKVEVNVLACGEGRSWCPSFDCFFEKDMDFDKFRIEFDYDNVVGYELSPSDVTGYRYEIESYGRGHELERIPRDLNDKWVHTIGEVYILDREYISPKEARAWASYKFEDEDVGIFEPAEAPPLSEATVALIRRVEEVDKKGIRLALPPDERLISIYYGKRKPNIGERALSLFKTMLGVTQYKSRKNARQGWARFKQEQLKKNRERNSTGN